MAGNQSDELDMLWQIMSLDEVIGSDWNERELHIEKTFVRFAYKKDSLQAEKVSFHYLFVTGVSELRGAMKEQSQILPKYEHPIEKGKFILVPQNENTHADVFRKLSKEMKKEGKEIFQIHSKDRKYITRGSMGKSDYLAEETFDENQMLEGNQEVGEVLVKYDDAIEKEKYIFISWNERNNAHLLKFLLHK